MQVIVEKIRSTLPSVNDDILSYITGLKSIFRNHINSFFCSYLDILQTNKTDYLDFQEVEDALRPILEEVAHDKKEQESISELCQFVCDQLRL